MDRREFMCGSMAMIAASAVAKVGASPSPCSQVELHSFDGRLIQVGSQPIDLATLEDRLLRVSDNMPVSGNSELKTP